MALFKLQPVLLMTLTHVLAFSLVRFLCGENTF